MRAWLVGLTSTIVVLEACGYQPARITAEQGAGRQSQSPSQAPTPDAQFLAAAATFENFQIEAADIARQKSQSQAVKTYAADATMQHRAALRALLQAAQSAGLPPPSTDLNEDYRAYLDRLRSEDIAIPFDTRYISEQTLITMSMAGRYDAYTSTAPDSALKQWASTQTQVMHDQISAVHQLSSDVLAH